MTRKLTARQHVHMPPWRNQLPNESYSDEQRVGYSWGHFRTCWDRLGMVSRRSSSEHRVCYAEPRTFGTYTWCCMRSRPLTTSSALAKYMELLPQGWRSKPGCEMLPTKLWSYYITRRTMRWSTLGTVTFWAEHMMEPTPWCCLSELAILWRLSKIMYDSVHSQPSHKVFSTFP
jgi:hypothetical protein